MTSARLAASFKLRAAGKLLLELLGKIGRTGPNRSESTIQPKGVGFR
jgi:hypothetical protein